LPLSVEDIEAMQGSTEPSLMMWGLFAAQLRDLDWELRRLDVFAEYCEHHQRAGTLVV
jgi:hypothetical protein